MLSMDGIKKVLSGKAGVEGDKVGKSSKKPTEMTPAEEAWDILKTILLAVAITLVFRMIAWQPFNIPSGSMRPNLLVGDFLVVSKFEYGYSKASLVYPFTRLPLEGRIFGSSPEQGDVVVFKNSRDGNRDYIKRVIGLPGDEIRTVGGIVYLNGQPLAREFISDQTILCESYQSMAKTYREILPNGVSYTIQECYGNNYRNDNVGPFTVPEGHFFMMGDNRDNSQDSRTPLVGMVPADQIVGRAQRLVFSVDGANARIWEIWNWPSAIRFSRIFDPVEMSKKQAADLENLQETLGYRFRDLTLLERAITHSSLSNEQESTRNLERLEFLGDRVLGLMTAEDLWRRYPDFSEGDMAPRFNALVRKETCANAARAIGLQTAVRLSPAEEDSGGREKAAILGDVCEALLGALYIDGGLEAARKAYDLYWTRDFERLASRFKDSKTALQEWAQAKLKTTPSYRVLANRGPAHAPVFEVKVIVEGLKPETASGRSKRAAQSLAAQRLLIREKVWTEDDII